MDTIPEPEGLNVPLLRKTFEHISEHPEEWDQEFWRCETGQCFAGWAALLDGAKWATAEVGSRASYVIAPDGREVHVEDYAERALGLSRDRRDAGLGCQLLFAGRNSLDDIRSILTDWGVL